MPEKHSNSTTAKAAEEPVSAQESIPAAQTITIRLQKIPLLAGVGQEALEGVAKAMQIRAVAKGGFVLHKGSAAEHLLFLLSGRLQVVDLTEDGNEVGLTFLSAGDYFGELSILDNMPRSASVVACEASLLGFLPRAQALELIYHQPMVAERVLKRLAEKVRTASNYRTILSIPNAYQRVFALLNQFAKTAPGGLVVIEKMPTQQEIAITVNTSRETVSRAIQTLIQKGVVEKDLRRLIVRLPEALRNSVKQDSTAVDRLISQTAQEK
jgi:CRP/FNR family transcriptional regulator, cyclic AMP receptor protein